MNKRGPYISFFSLPVLCPFPSSSPEHWSPSSSLIIFFTSCPSFSSITIITITPFSLQVGSASSSPALSIISASPFLLLIVTSPAQPSLSLLLLWSGSSSAAPPSSVPLSSYSSCIDPCCCALTHFTDHHHHHHRLFLVLLSLLVTVKAASHHHLHFFSSSESRSPSSSSSLHHQHHRRPPLLHLLWSISSGCFCLCCAAITIVGTTGLLLVAPWVSCRPPWSLLLLLSSPGTWILSSSPCCVSVTVDDAVSCCSYRVRCYCCCLPPLATPWTAITGQEQQLSSSRRRNSFIFANVLPIAASTGLREEIIQGGFFLHLFFFSGRLILISSWFTSFVGDLNLFCVSC